MGKKKSKKKNKKEANLIEQGSSLIKDADSIQQDSKQQDSHQVEKKGEKTLDSILGNSNIRALITALVAAAVEQLLELLAKQGNGSNNERVQLSQLGNAIQPDSNPGEKTLNTSNILGNSSVRALITALAVAAVEQLLEMLAKQGGNSNDGDSRLSKLGDAIKEAALSLQGMVDGKSGLTETMSTVKDAIAEIKPVVAGVMPVVQGVVSALKDKADDGKAAVQKAIADNSDEISDAVQSVRPTPQA